MTFQPRNDINDLIFTKKEEILIALAPRAIIILIIPSRNS